jgi:hypothetical protein
MWDDSWVELPVLIGELNDYHHDLFEKEGKNITENDEHDWCYDDSDMEIETMEPLW